MVLPLVAYGALLTSAFLARSTVGISLFGVAAAALFLLFIGIYHAWDNVTYLVLVKPKSDS